MTAHKDRALHDRGWPRRGAPLATLCLVAVALIGPSASAAPISGEATLQEGEYYFFGIQNPYPGRDWVIDVNWTASDPIDMWVMNKTDFHAYEANLTFGFEAYHQGSFHHHFLQIKANRAAEEPFYLVFDNTDAGNNHPVADPGNHVPHITVTGLTREDGMVITGPTGSDSGLGLIVALVLGVIIGVPALVIAQRVMDKKKKKQELEDIRRRLHAGEVVGKKQAPPPPPPPKAPPPQYSTYSGSGAGAPLPVPVSPSITSSAQLKAAAQAQKFCGRCGTRVEPGIKFCGGCGAPV